MKTRIIDKIILHCSASDNKADDNIEVIDKWHEERGFKYTLEDGTEKHVGYHYFIQKNGNLQKGRPENKVGAHCKDHNANSIGMCLHGLSKDKFTAAQFKTLAKTLQDVLTRYPNATIHGHNEFANKLCPVFDVDDFIEEYMSNIPSINIKG